MIPATTLRALDLYVNEHIRPGGFLYAVLTNDLFGAISRADIANGDAIRDICLYIYNELPADCWGSRDVVRRYLAQKTYTSLQASLGSKLALVSVA